MVALTAMLGVSIVGAIAASPNPDAASAVVAVETTAPATTLPATTIQVSTTSTVTTVAMITVPATTVVGSVAVAPVTAAIALMTADVVDGDTITMSDGSTVRLIGIDAPERGECGHDDASMLLTQLISGHNITLVPGARDDVDKYGRLLRYVEADGVDLDLKMIESGRAIARYDGRDGYGAHARQDAYVEADERTTSINGCAAVVPAVVPIAVVPVPVAPVDSTPPATAHYRNCGEVRSAGAAPIRAGDPGWQSKFDRDGDGVGCE